MFICEHCGRKFNRKEGRTLHQKTCLSIPDWIIEIDDDYKLYHHYCNKKSNAIKEGISCQLTYEEYALKVKEANLHSSDLGFSGKGYVLARTNDSGDYTIESCRFILQSENAQEKIISEKSREASRTNITKYNETRPKIKKQEKYRHPYAYKGPSGDPRYSGEHNSSYGSHWITNGIENIKWYDDISKIPDGYYPGRTC